MKYIVYILLMFGVLSSSCNRRETIPDGVLVDIFHDVFLANAYKYENIIQVDTGQMYAPIFAKYGYSVEDVGHTIGSFSKRKSARLSDVVERAIKKLERETQWYASEVKILDNIDVVSLREATKVIYQADELKFQGEEDADLVNIKLVNIVEGGYKVEFDYNVDSLDKNDVVYRASLYFEQIVQEHDYHDDMEHEELLVKGEGGKPSLRKASEVKLNLNSRVGGRISRTITAHSPDDISLCISLVEWSGKLKHSPSITIKNLKVTYVPTKAQAPQRYYEELLDVPIFGKALYLDNEQTYQSELPPAER